MAVLLGTDARHAARLHLAEAVTSPWQIHALPNSSMANLPSPSNLCTAGGFQGGNCLRIPVSDDEVETLRLECTYEAWARVSVIASAPSQKGQLPPVGTFCASRLGGDSLLHDRLEHSTWASACGLYARLGVQNYTVPCYWRDALLTDRPYFTVARRLPQVFTAEYFTYVSCTLLCFVSCCACIWCAMYIHNEAMFPNMGCILAAGIVLATYADFSQALPLSSTIYVLVFAVLVGKWLADCDEYSNWIFPCYAVAYTSYVFIGSFCFMDEVVQLCCFVVRGLVTVILLEFMRKIQHRRWFRRREGVNSDLAAPMLADIATDIAAVSLGVVPCCSACGFEVFFIPGFSRPLRCGRCAVSELSRALNAAANARVPGQRFRLTRIADHFFELETTLASPSESIDGHEEGAGVLEALGLCMVCMEFTAVCVLAPCGHGGLCEICARRIVARSGTRACHLCRVRPESVISIDTLAGPSAEGSTLNVMED